MRLSFFNSKLEYIEKLINKKHSRQVSIFYIIHDEDGDIVKSKHKKYTHTGYREFQEYFSDIINSNLGRVLKKYYITFLIIEDALYKDNSNYYKIKELDSIFFHAREAKNNIIKIIFTFTLKYYTLFFAIFTSLTIFSTFKFLDFLPSSTIVSESIALKLTEHYVSLGLLIFIVITISVSVMWTIDNVTNLFLSKQAILRNSTYYIKTPYLDISKFFVLSLVIVIGLFTWISPYSQNPYFANIITSYLVDEQVPIPLKVKFDNIEDNKTKTIMYLGENKNFIYMPAIDINALIYRNLDVIKEVCMGEPKPYLNHLMPLIQNDILDNRLHKRARVKDVHIYPANIYIQSAFCYVKYPYFAKLKTTGEEIFIMGRKAKTDKYYYLNLEVIKNHTNLKEICAKKGDFIVNLMRSNELSGENFEKIDEIEIKDTTNKLIRLDNFSFCKKNNK